jgi:hypothetical protein
VAQVVVQLSIIRVAEEEALGVIQQLLSQLNQQMCSPSQLVVQEKPRQRPVHQQQLLLVEARRGLLLQVLHLALEVPVELEPLQQVLVGQLEPPDPQEVQEVQVGLRQVEELGGLPKHLILMEILVLPPAEAEVAHIKLQIPTKQVVQVVQVR